MLRINNADKYFNKYKKNKIHVINNTSLDLDNAGLVALLGPSGCGKTTLLNVIGGLDKLGHGSIYINNQKISSKFMYKVDRIRNINIGYIFQDYKLIEDLSVFDNVSIVLKMLGIKDKKEIKEKVEYVLDCVGMLRYKRRPASMLSGGERQRVGIARALVKDPNIILADEPTGNLDSKNSLEIMKIIKAISLKRLVILVTHEQNLAKFYATRIIEIEDGTIKNDYKNEVVNDLDYIMDSNFYLKDFKNNINFTSGNIGISLFRNENENVSLDIAVKNGNIYIKSNTKEKIEVVDDESSIEFINDSYKKISRNDQEKYSFDFDKISGRTKKRYASIINIYSLILEGFRKVFDYSILKKILLVGFFLAGMFIMYSVSSYMATKVIREEDYVSVAKDYLTIDSAKNKLDDYLNIERNDKILYMIPGTSKISITVPLNDYFQTNKFNQSMDVSIASSEVLTDKDLLYGKLPENNNEVVLDKLAFTNTTDENPSYQMAGIIDVSDMLNRTIMIEERVYTIVGISSKVNPCLYVLRNELYPILYVANKDKSSIKDDTTTVSNLLSYDEYKDKLEIKKGRIPNNDYEIIINKSNEDSIPLNKTIDVKLNGKKLLVVGYYTSKYNLNDFFNNNNTIKYLTIVKSKSFTIMPKLDDKDNLIHELEGKKYHVVDTYKRSYDKYIKNKKKQNNTTLIVSGIILIISFIEIFLMIRSSFLSRIKEVGIYRAIGVKRIDICKMFTGEIFAITTLASMPGLILMGYILKVISGIKYLSSYILVNTGVFIISIILVYGFNLIVGLIPVINTIRKRPAEILSRYDLD